MLCIGPQRRLLADMFSVERASTVLGAGGEAATLWHAKDRERNEELSRFLFAGGSFEMVVLLIVKQNVWSNCSSRLHRHLETRFSLTSHEF